MDWDTYFMKMAQLIASKSKDPATKVGAVAVGSDNEILSSGFNGLARGVLDHRARLERPVKYKYILHGESNCVAHAARVGVKLKGSRLYCTHHPCSQCAALIIQAGIRQVIIGGGQTSMPKEEFEIAKVMFEESDVSVRQYVVEEECAKNDKEVDGKIPEAVLPQATGSGCEIHN